MTMHAVEDPRTEQPELCRATTFVGGNEFICIAKVHTTEADVRLGRPRIDRHYFVRRYPFREMT